jgi:mono/diheme cytochrome c family protein
LVVGLILLLAMSGTASANGRDIFSSNCVICHQSNAQGIPGMYPALAYSIGSYVAIPAGRAYLVHVLSFGLTGAISVHGQVFNGVMKPWTKFKEEDVAQVLNYVVTCFKEPAAERFLTADE